MRRTFVSHRSLAIAALAVGLSACNGNSGFNAGAPSLPLSSQSVAQVQTQLPLKRTHHRGSSGKIQHVVIIVQENRSFNNLFYGFPGATTSTYGYDSSGKKITLQPVSLATNWDIYHTASEFIAACDGTGSIPGTNCRMNGFDKEYWQCGTAGFSSCPNANPPYSYVPHSETQPYFDIGEQYVVADQMYSSNFDGSSFTSHQFIFTAQSDSTVNYPSSAVWGCSGGPGDKIPILGPDRQFPDGNEQVCFSDTSLGQEADKAGVSWGYYTGALKHPATFGTLPRQTTTSITVRIGRTTSSPLKRSSSTTSRTESFVRSAGLLRHA